MHKKAIIVVSLIEESEDVTNDELKKQIVDELSETALIPWMEKVEKVQIVEN